jgi:hypothetical protein
LVVLPEVVDVTATLYVSEEPVYRLLVTLIQDGIVLFWLISEIALFAPDSAAYCA